MCFRGPVGPQRTARGRGEKGKTVKSEQEEDKEEPGVELYRPVPTLRGPTE